MERKRVLAFGTFDGLHPGHVFFLRSAKSRGSELVVGVARDSHVRTLKDKRTTQPEHVRLEKVKKLPYVQDARLSDKELDSYQIVEELDPDLIVLGHDQFELEQSLLEWMSQQNHYLPMIKIKKL